MNGWFEVSGFCHRDERICYAVAWVPAGVLLCDTKQGPDGPKLLISFREWAWLIRAIKDGTSGIDNIPVRLAAPMVYGRAVTLTRTPDGDIRVTGRTEDDSLVSLNFTPDEHNAFEDGVLDNQFDSATSEGRQPAYAA